MHILLFYDYVPDYAARREAFRAAHLALARQAEAEGRLLLAGTTSDPGPGAVLLFQAASPEEVQAFVAADPYVQNGLVTRWRLQPWHTVIGRGATAPIGP